MEKPNYWEVWHRISPDSPGCLASSFVLVALVYVPANLWGRNGAEFVFQHTWSPKAGDWILNNSSVTKALETYPDLGQRSTKPGDLTRDPLGNIWRFKALEVVACSGLGPGQAQLLRSYSSTA